jgi:hypothetical protein
MDFSSIEGDNLMRPGDYELSQKLEKALTSFEKEVRSLPGIHTSEAFVAFIEQILDSVHRFKYISIIATRNLSEKNKIPSEQIFDPLKAAILHQRDGNINEAFWLVFLLTHFGKNSRTGWHYVRMVYGKLDSEEYWSWNNTSANPGLFRKWLNDSQDVLRNKDGVRPAFGNHRKYQSLDAYSKTGTGAAIESYIDWVGPTKNHEHLIDKAYKESSNDPKMSFDYLYNSMKAVTSFGRTARFDYLTMIGHVGLAKIEPRFAYLQGATGPQYGARLLFGGARTSNISVVVLDNWLTELDSYLQVGMQVIEDSICNWQKEPMLFKKFRG